MHKIPKHSLIATTSALLVTAFLVAAADSDPRAFAHEGEEPVEEGRMTGGGRIAAPFVMTHGFELRCDESEPNNLQVNWDRGNRFHLQDVESIDCFDDPAFNPRPPRADFDTLEISGFGKYNGESGAFVWAQFVDGGEPGRNDWATIVIFDGDGNLVLDVTGRLDNGNHQAH